MPGQFDRVFGRIRAGAGDDRRLPLGDFDAESDQPLVLVIGERGRFAGRAARYEAVRALAYLPGHMLLKRALVERVAERGPALLDELRSALRGSDIVEDVRGHGFLLGFELVDPRDGESFLPVDLDAASLVDDTALEHGVLVTSTHPQADGFAGDQVLIAPPYVTGDDELAQMVERIAATIADVERIVKDRLPAASGSA
jgi:4-aminobutyrate aminotransferase-like enzyme